MPARTLPNLGLQSFFDLGEDGWKDENDLNMLKLSVLVQGGVSARVDALPPAPVDGQVIIFTTDQTVQVYDAGAWVAFTPMEGWLLFDRATDEYVTFDGDAWAVLETGGGGGGGEYPLPDPTGMGGKIVAAKADGTGYELVDDQVGTGGGGGGGPETPAQAAHKFWRVYCRANNGDTYTGLGEVYFRDVAGVEFPPAGATVIKSGESPNGSLGYAVQAFDRNLSNRWETPIAVGAWIGLQYPTAVRVRRLSLTAGNQYPAQMMKNFDIQWSDDGVTWTTRWSQDNITAWGVAETRNFADPVEDPVSTTIPSPTGNTGKALIVAANGRELAWGGTRESIVIALGDEVTAITTGAAKVTFRMPYAFTLEAVRASLTTASSNGLPTVDIKENGVSILSTKLTIDQGEKTSVTAAVPAVIADTVLADDAEITFNIDVAGTGAAGLKVVLIGRQ